MKWDKIHTALLILSICIITIIYIDIETLLRHQELNQKERLFSIIDEWAIYYFKLYFLVPEVIALVMIIVSHKTYKGTKLYKYSLISFLVSLILTIVPIWRAFI